MSLFAAEACLCVAHLDVHDVSFALFVYMSARHVAGASSAVTLTRTHAGAPRPSLPVQPVEMRSPRSIYPGNNDV